MKNKFLKIMLLVVVCLIVTGCDGNVTRNIRHAGFTLDSSEFKCDPVMPKDKEDQSYAKIKYMMGNYMVLEDGTLYDLNIGQYYSNNQNCKISNTEKKVVSVFDDKYFKSKDDKYYYLNSNGDTQPFMEVPKTENSYGLIDTLLKDATNVKVVTGDSSSGTYYVLKNDGNVYKYIVIKDNNTKVETITSTSVFYDKKEFGMDKISDFSYAGDSLGTFIKGDNKVYRMKVSNNDECGKYADVKCTYSLQEDLMFTEYADRIIFYNGSYLITDYGKKFNVAF